MKLSFLRKLIVSIFTLGFTFITASFIQADDKSNSVSIFVQQGVDALQSGNKFLAFQSFQKAADWGDPVGEYKLGNCYFEGLGVKLDYAQAVQLYRKSAAQGSQKAEYALGLCYEFGDSVLQNFPQALKWYRKAAAQGFPLAKLRIGFCYKDGRGVKRNNATATRWFLQAADSGDVQVEYALGFYYEEGKIVAKDDAEAVKWFQKAADQGDMKSEQKLGMHLEKGLGTVQNLPQAKFWYEKAKAQGSEYAIDALERLSGAPSLVGRADDDTFEAQVLKADKPVLVDYYATWCGPCRAYRPIIDQIAKEYQGQLKVVRVNLDDCPKLSKQYEITGIPDSYIFNQKGKLIFQWMGLTDQDKVEAYLEKFLKLKISAWQKLLNLSSRLFRFIHL